MSAVNILVADDHQIVRQGVRTLLESVEGFNIVGEAVDGSDLLRQGEHLQPDILILDLMVPELNGLEALARLEALSPPTRAVIFSMHSSKPYVSEAFQRGAWGYVSKGTSNDELVRAVAEVAAGRRYLSPPLSAEDIEFEKRADAEDPYELLTRREREVLGLVAAGKTSAEIAAQLSISARTVEVHRANLMCKLSLRNQADVIRYTFQRGLLPLDIE